MGQKPTHRNMLAVCVVINNFNKEIQWLCTMVDQKLQKCTESDDLGPSTSISQPTSPTDLQYDVIPESANTLPPQVRRIAVVDGMFVVKKLKKSSKVNTVKDVSTLFNSQFINMTCSYDEIIFVFDTYEPDSLNMLKSTATTTRKKKDSKVKIMSCR